MVIREALTAPHRLRYDPALGPQQPAQIALRDARSQFSSLFPIGYRVRVSGAAQNLPKVPWIALLDQSITTTAQAGLYVVYLFSADLRQVFLSLNQGVTAHWTTFRQEKVSRPWLSAIGELRRESQLIAARMQQGLDGLANSISLGSNGNLPRAYEAGSIAARAYSIDTLPDEQALEYDLRRFLALYRDAIVARNDLLLQNPREFRTPTNVTRDVDADPTAWRPEFRPKDSSEYLAHISSQLQRRERKHESLIVAFWQQLQHRDVVVASNVHPRDLVVIDGEDEYLIEAKVVGRNAEYVVREAIGQLFSYRHFCYRSRRKKDPHLVALFSEPVGEAFLSLLSALEISVIWWDCGRWDAVGSAKRLLDS